MQLGRTDRRPGGGWRSRSARWPRSARLATWALVALIGLTLLGAAVGEDRTEARTAGPTSTTTTAPPPSTSAATTTTPAATTTTATTEAPATTTGPAPPPAPTTAWAPPPTEPPSPAGAPAGGYPNCSAARAAGAAPVHIGEPGYAPRLDGDGDGVGCE
jgi:hypothetical protein